MVVYFMVHFSISKAQEPQPGILSLSLEFLCPESWDMWNPRCPGGSQKAFTMALEGRGWTGWWPLCYGSSGSAKEGIGWVSQSFLLLRKNAFWDSSFGERLILILFLLFCSKTFLWRSSSTNLGIYPANLGRKYMSFSPPVAALISVLISRKIKSESTVSVMHKGKWSTRKGELEESLYLTCHHPSSSLYDLVSACSTADQICQVMMWRHLYLDLLAAS